eukprot:1339568-Rhodomonas_salina.1
MGAMKLGLLYRVHPGAQDEIKAAGGVKAFCALHHSLVRFISDAGPGRLALALHPCVSRLAPPSGAVADTRQVLGAGRGGFVGGAREGGLRGEGGEQNVRRRAIVDTLVEILDAHLGDMDGANACHKLYAVHPGAREIVRSVGGIKEFCAVHAAKLRFIPDGGPGR